MPISHCWFANWKSLFACILTRHLIDWTKEEIVVDSVQRLFSIFCWKIKSRTHIGPFLMYFCQQHRGQIQIVFYYEFNVTKSVFPHC